MSNRPWPGNAFAKDTAIVLDVPPDQSASPARLGLYPIVTSQYSSTTLYQVSYHIQ